MSGIQERVLDRAWVLRMKRSDKPRRGPYEPTMLPQKMSVQALRTIMEKRRKQLRRWKDGR